MCRARTELKSIFGLAFLLVFCAPLYCPDIQARPLRLQYTRLVPGQYQELMNDDIKLMQSFPWKDSDGEMSRIFQVPVVGPESLEAWLGLRARYVVETSFGTTEANPSNVETPLAQSLLRIVMENVGVTMYLDAKAEGKTAKVFLDGIGSIAVTTSQIGIFRIGSGLFQLPKNNSDPEYLAHFVRRVYRLQTLFHEARHGDGNGEHVAFDHVDCPAGHDYAGFPACDAAANGPYRIASLIIRSAFEGCEKNGFCRSSDVEALKLKYLDYLSRIISPLKAGKNIKVIEYDPTPERASMIDRIGIDL